MELTLERFGALMAEPRRHTLRIKRGARDLTLVVTTRRLI